MQYYITDSNTKVPEKWTKDKPSPLKKNEKNVFFPPRTTRSKHKKKLETLNNGKTKFEQHAVDSKGRVVGVQKNIIKVKKSSTPSKKLKKSIVTDWTMVNPEARGSGVGTKFKTNLAGFARRS